QLAPLVVEAAAGEGGVEVQVAIGDRHRAEVVIDAAADAAGGVFVQLAIEDVHHQAGKAVDAAAVPIGGVMDQGGTGDKQRAGQVVDAPAGLHGMVVLQGAVELDRHPAVPVVHGPAHDAGGVVRQESVADLHRAVDGGDGAALLGVV